MAADDQDFPASAAAAPQPSSQSARNTYEAAYYLGFGALALLLTSLPYLIGWLTTPPGHVYTGLTYNIEDGAAYYSWLQQAIHGRFFIHNQFAVEPQRDLLFNLFFWLLGSIARVLGLSLPAIYQAARIVSGAALLGAIALLLQETLTTARARKIAFAVVCLGSGLGWIWSQSPSPETGPVDLWQPEAITFLSLYFCPLFTAATALMVVFLTSALRWERRGRFQDLWPAMGAGLLLGNFHSYDIIHVFAVWVVYRLVMDIMDRRLSWRRWLGVVVAGIAALPTTGYQRWVLSVDPVFYQRAFVSNTLSTKPVLVLLGFGLLLPLAIAGALLSRRSERFTGSDALRLLIVWAIVGIAVSYIPVSFQRKLLMGAQIPWALLAGAGLAALTDRLSGDFPKIAVATTVALLMPTNVWFLFRDTSRLQANLSSTPQPPYLTTDEVAAFDWLRAHTDLRDVVLVGPDPAAIYPRLAVYVPGFGGCTVYDGHWSETPQFQKKLSATIHFFRVDTDDDYRRTLLLENGIHYVLQTNPTGGTPPLDAHGEPYITVPWPERDVPPYLKQVFANREMTLYRVDTPLAAQL